jgi:hypothetical protein
MLLPLLDLRLQHADLLPFPRNARERHGLQLGLLLRFGQLQLWPVLLAAAVASLAEGRVAAVAGL